MIRSLRLSALTIATTTGTVLKMDVPAISVGEERLAMSPFVRMTVRRPESVLTLAVVNVTHLRMVPTVPSSDAPVIVPVVVSATRTDIASATSASMVKIVRELTARVTAVVQTVFVCQPLESVSAAGISQEKIAPTAPMVTKENTVTNLPVHMSALVTVSVLLLSPATAIRGGLESSARLITALTTALIVVIVLMVPAGVGRVGKALSAPFQFVMVDSRLL